MWRAVVLPSSVRENGSLATVKEIFPVYCMKAYGVGDGATHPLHLSHGCFTYWERALVTH